MKLRVFARNFSQASIITITLLSPFFLQNTLKAQVDICDRTAQVQAEILRLINLPQNVSGVTCDTVTADQLATEVTNLILIDPTIDDFSSDTNMDGVQDNMDDIRTLRPGDFAGLTGLLSLDLRFNKLDENLPTGIFSDLTSLTTLELGGNDLTTLPSGIFSGLVNLTTLGLELNGLTSSMLPANLFSGLTSLQQLFLNNNALETLPADIFRNITDNDTPPALTTLNLSFNNLTELPPEIFSSLNNLTAVNVSVNPKGDLSAVPPPFTLTVTPVVTEEPDATGQGMAAIQVVQGVPFDVTATVSITGGNFSGNPSTTVTLSTGQTQSDPFPYTLDLNQTSTTITVAISSPNNTEINGVETYRFDTNTESFIGYNGFQLASGDPLIITNGICSRTQEVQTAILAQISETNECAEVTADQLTQITGTLRLGNENIASLKSGDFAGLTGLRTLFLNDNQLMTLDADIFAGLTALTWLNLDNNSLTDLPANIFAGLIDPIDSSSALTRLSLNGNGLSVLDKNIFNGLTNLTELFLSANELSELDKDIFNGLINLQRLFLNINELQDLPEGIFNGLINPNLDPPSSPLTTLNLSSNQLTDLPAGIFSGLTSLTAVDLSDNPEINPVPFILTATPAVTLNSSDSAPGMAVIEIPQGVPFTAVTATITITGGNFSGNNTTSATIPKGRTQSDPFPFILTDLSGVITVSNLISDPEEIGAGFRVSAGYSGFQLASGPALTVQARRNICSRTDTVRDEILSVINDINQSLAPLSSSATCSTVTLAQLAGITALSLNSKSISSLRSGDFADLTGLTSLDLSDNTLMTLPDGIFSGLTNLTGVDVSDNPNNGDFFTLPVTPKTTSASTAVIEVAQGVPFTNVTVNVSIEGGNFPDGTTSVTIPKGATQSPEFAYTVDPNAISTVLTVSTISNPMNSEILDGYDSATSIGYSGFQLVGEPLLIFGNGICNRTPQVQTAILNEIDTLAADECARVTPALLTEIEILTFLSGQPIASLRSEDFAGLSELTSLVLINNGLTTLPADIFNPLTNLTTLFLNDNSLTTLDATVFSELANLRVLDLSGNALETLPAGIFRSLANLTAVNVENNPDTDSDPLTLTSTLTEIREGFLAVEIVQGVPFTSVAAALSITGGEFPDGTSTATIEKGETRSAEFAYTADPNEIATVVAFSNLMSDPQTIENGYALDGDGILMGYSGFELVGEPLIFGDGICNRTDQVQAAILAASSVATVLGPSIAGVEDCNRVTNAMLSTIDEINLSNAGIASLKLEDFAGLTNLETLDLSGNDFAMLPVGIFSPLTNLTYLNLSETFPAFTASEQHLPVGVFDGLTSLTTLDLSRNALNALEATLFAPLTNLTELNLFASQLNTLQPGAFNGLTSLTTLYLGRNAFTTLDATAFDALTNLRTLDLSFNDLEELPARIFSDLDMLTGVNVSGNPQDDSPALPLTAIPKEISPGMAVVEVAQGVPFTNVTATVEIAGGEFSVGVTTMEVTIERGDTQTDAFPYTADPTEIATVIAVSTLRSENILDGFDDTTLIGYSGFELVSGDPLVFGDGVCNRTPAVQTVILEAINDDPDRPDTPVTCNTVTNALLAEIETLTFLSGQPIASLQSRDFAGLVNLTKLVLENNGLTTLPADIFNGLEKLRTLDLSGNELRSLPDELFSGLTALEGADFSNNPASDPVDLILTLTLQITEVQNQFVVEVAQGAPTDLIATVRISGGTFSESSITATTTISTGMTRSSPIAIIPTHLGVSPLLIVTVSETFTAFDTAFNGNTGYSGLTIVAPAGQEFRLGICDRTLQVQNVILSAINNAVPPPDPAVTCSTVTLAQLREIAVPLTLSGLTEELRGGDFEGLSGVTELTLLLNAFTSLPDDVFSGLSGLESLSMNLHRNLTSLPDGIFSDLTSLVSLNLATNELTSVSAELFAGLTSLTSLELGVNQLSGLDANTFSSLSGLTRLGLAGNDLTSLDRDAFAGLSALETLDLSDNGLTALPSEIFSGLGNDTFDGLTNLTTLDLNSNQLRALPDGIFSGLTALTGVDASGQVADGNTIPSLPLTVTLQETGQGIGAVQVAQGVPFTSITATLSITGGTFSNDNDAITVTITKGETESSSFVFTVDEPTPDMPVPEAAIRIADTASDPTNILNGFVLDENSNLLSGYSGFRFEAVESVSPLTLEGICGRTDAVEMEILRLINMDGVSGVTCDAVTSDQLAGITGTLDLSSQPIETLMSGDFAGLSGLEILDLSNNELMSLPPEIFSGLSALTSLDVSNNMLESLPEGVFAGLTSLMGVNMLGNNPPPEESSASPIGIFFSPPPAELFTLVLVLRKTEEDSDSFVIEVAEGAPTTLTAAVTIQGGTVTDMSGEKTATPRIVIPTGSTKSEEITVEPVSGFMEATVSMTTTSDLTAFNNGMGYSGLNITGERLRLSRSPLTQRRNRLKR